VNVPFDGALLQNSMRKPSWMRQTEGWELIVSKGLTTPVAPARGRAT
jgi:hypothetical protein